MTEYHDHRDDCPFKFATLDVCDCVEKNMLDRIEALTAERDAAIARAEAAEAALRRGQTYSTSVAVCPICDIAGCSHLTTKHGEQP